MTAFRFGRAYRYLWLCVLVFFVVPGGFEGVAVADVVTAAPAASAIVGDWLVESRDAVIRIERVGDEYQGYILWQLHDTYGPEDGPQLNGKTVTDRNNPDPAQRSQPLTGLRLLKGLRYDVGDNKWTGGRVYNAENGRTYRCLVRLLSPNRLQLRGYIGISLLGGNTVWSRVAMRNPGPGGLPFVMDVPDK
ncbi:hypothetical protein GCM10007862_32020 [Dyella lipolytica]|uniref:DUF2147 domain-containing protein n=1 Tax=Dyella lipolytica TaxID=1867835 RepID=A0ABW8IWE9_9GAMM|nr:DUF2147 domain-containing protein [Dyella lipolytica]GLQ48151.1 hypothetical protein GCM10007862_32020 [Dyella lipolytica]